MPIIKLTKGAEAIVDEADYPELSLYKWQLHDTGGKQYARRTYRDGTKKVNVYMHRVILLGEPEIDHIDGDGLNNSRSNLRHATRSEQMRWRRMNRSRSGYKGVYKQSRSERFYARIECDGVTYGLGTYDTPEEAARAYNTKAAELFGQFAHLNVIPDPVGEAA